MDKHSDFKIIKCGNHCVLINTKGSYSQHTHIKRYGTCKLLIDLICNKRVPDSDYLRTSAKRLSRDEKYIRKIEHKERKDRDKQRYYNINKGGVRFR